MITPSKAPDIFIASSVGGESIERISAKIAPFLLVLILGIILITYVPEISMFLPGIRGQI